MDITEIHCVDNGQIAPADILHKNDRMLEVAIVGTNTPIKLFKKTPDAKVYYGRYAGLEFTSTGESPKT
jgi:hypothetical protein